MMNMRQALLRRAELLGEGITGGASANYGLTGGCGGRVRRRARGITGGRKKAPKRKATRAKRKTGSTPAQLKPWMAHVKKVRAAHPNKPYKQVLVMASKSYRKC